MRTFDLIICLKWTLSEFHLQLVNTTCTISSEHYHGKCARLIGDFIASSQRSLQACSAQGVGRAIYMRLIFEGESLDIVRQREAGIDLENLYGCNT